MKKDGKVVMPTVKFNEKDKPVPTYCRKTYEMTSEILKEMRGQIKRYREIGGKKKSFEGGKTWWANQTSPLPSKLYDGNESITASPRICRLEIEKPKNARIVGFEEKMIQMKSEWTETADLDKPKIVALRPKTPSLHQKRKGRIKKQRSLSSTPNQKKKETAHLIYHKHRLIKRRLSSDITQEGIFDISEILNITNGKIK
ncbi:unnamed protein product [Blepharisma stoltei]|uniref:Uncharacterized protein n=1 Tax=Blepharisma stoltei TaxID=1481888 RepID=A0AAU9JVE4_9CILI|nr:unnamed protein product [Blepharisma stoltei]